MRQGLASQCPDSPEGGKSEAGAGGTAKSRPGAVPQCACSEAVHARGSERWLPAVRDGHCGVRGE